MLMPSWHAIQSSTNKTGPWHPSICFVRDGQTSDLFVRLDAIVPCVKKHPFAKLSSMEPPLGKSRKSNGKCWNLSSMSDQTIELMDTQKSSTCANCLIANSQIKTKAIYFPLHSLYLKILPMQLSWMLLFWTLNHLNSSDTMSSVWWCVMIGPQLTLVSSTVSVWGLIFPVATKDSFWTLIHWLFVSIAHCFYMLLLYLRFNLGESTPKGFATSQSLWTIATFGAKVFHR